MPMTVMPFDCRPRGEYTKAWEVDPKVNPGYEWGSWYIDPSSGKPVFRARRYISAGCGTTETVYVSPGTFLVVVSAYWDQSPLVTKALTPEEFDREYQECDD